MISPRSLLSRTGWSEGDVWTVSLGLALALSLAISSIPAALQGRPPQLLAAPAATPTPQATQPPPLVVLPLPSPPPEPPPLSLSLPEPARFPDQSAAPTPPGPEPTNSPSAHPIPRPTVPAGALLPFAALGTEGTAGGLTTGPDGAVHAATDAPGKAGGASFLLSWDDTGKATNRTTAPHQPAGRQRGLTALATTTSGDILATDAATSRLLRYVPSTGRWTVVATVPDVAPCLLPGATACQPGLQDTAPLLRGLAVDPDGTAYVADAGQGTIWRLAAGGASFKSWYSSSDLIGAQALAGLDLDASGAVLLAVTRLTGLTGLTADGSGTLDRIARAADHSAGTRTTVTRFAPGEDAVDVAISSAGVYVALRGSSAVVTLGPDGTEQQRVTGKLLTTPTALSLSNGHVLVTTGGAHPAVLQVGVADHLTS